MTTDRNSARLPAPSSPPHPRVLVVDDNATVRTGLRAVLQEEGYPVIEAPDGVVALDILHALPYGVVVLCDHSMPRLDGPGLLRRVRAEQDLANRHAYIYMTAATRQIPLELQRLLDTLDAPRLGKPFTIDAVLEAVERAARKLARSASA